ncbi:MAG: ADP-ribosylglycohydrolase family protein [Clostridia bacterium]|nr:ADP-ribosylglycohydrolase family protein [Clostridia bacterium]
MIYTDATKEALKLCFEVHKDQADKTGVPYVFHPFHLAEQMPDEDTAVCALLHDVVEDGGVTFSELESRGFNERVISALRLLTHDPAVPYLDYVRGIRKDPIARAVKKADLAHNSDLSRWDAVDKRTLARTKKYMEAMKLLMMNDCGFTEKTLSDRLRGCLIGGAAGDALGYAVEFVGEGYIFSRYGKSGITEYALDREGGKAEISDDTQMTLFTAEAVRLWYKNRNLFGREARLRCIIEQAYFDWLTTQDMSFEASRSSARRPAAVTRLFDWPELYSPRAPGNTCLSGLRTRMQNGDVEDFVVAPLNHSKGCGGIMRTAPIAFIDCADIEALDREGAQAAAITHGSPLGFLPSAAGVHIVNRLIYNREDRTLKEIVLEAADAVRTLYPEHASAGEALRELLLYAVELSENGEPDLENIHRLGEGWVGDEALAIAVYCCLRHPSDFSACIIAAANHRGDSDSTGAIAGNILGAHLGFSAIETKWKTDLELRDRIIGLADELALAIGGSAPHEGGF